MAQRLNKKLVVGLTIAGMALTTAAGVIMIVKLAPKDPRPLVEQAEQLAAADPPQYVQAMQYYQKAWGRAKAAAGEERDLRQRETRLEEARRYLVLAGDMALKAGKAREAREAWHTVVRDNPTGKQIHPNETPASREAQERIVKLFLEFVQMSGNDSGVWSSLAEEAEKLCAMDPESGVGLSAWGMALINQRDVNQSNLKTGEEKLVKAFELNKGNPELAENLARHYLIEAQRKLGEPRTETSVREADKWLAQATAVYEELARHVPTDPAQKKQAAQCWETEGRFHLNRMELARERITSERHAGLTPNAALQNEWSAAGQAALAALDKAQAAFSGLDAASLRERLARIMASTASNEAQNDQINALASELSSKLGEEDRQRLSAILSVLGDYWLVTARAAEEDPEHKKETASLKEDAKGCYKLAVSLAPFDFNPYQRLARLYQLQNQLDEAMQVLQKRIDWGIQRGTYLEGRNLYSMAIIRSQAFQVGMAQAVTLDTTAADYDARLADLLKKLKALHKGHANEARQGERDPGALFMAARIHMLEGHRSAAIRALEDAQRQLNPPNAEIGLYLANLYAQDGQSGLAEKTLKEVVQALPRNDNALGMLAALQVQLGQNEGALLSAQKALQLNPNNRQALVAMARVYEKQGNIEELRKIQAASAQSPAGQKILEATILLRPEDGAPEPTTANLARAETLLREALATEPLNTLALRHLVGVLSRKEKGADQVSKLLDDVEAAVKAPPAGTSQPSDQDTRTILTTIRRLRIAYGDANLTQEQKIGKIEELIQEGTDPFIVATELAQLYSGAGRNQDAIKQLQTALAMPAKDQRVKAAQTELIRSLFSLALLERDWGLAEQCISKAVEAGAVRAGGRFLRGRLAMARSQADASGKTPPDQKDHLLRAVQEFEAGLKEFPSYSDGQMWLGQSLLALNELDRSRTALEEALRINPRNGMAALGLAQLAERRGDDAQKQRYLLMLRDLMPNHPAVQAAIQEQEDESNPEQAIARREKHRESNPDDLANLIRLAGLYGRVNRFADAEAVFQACRKLKPDNLELVGRYAQFLREKNPPEPQRAETMLRETIQRVPDDQAVNKATAQLMLAGHLESVLRQGGGDAQALAAVDTAYRAAANIAATPEVHMDIGIFFLRTRRPAEAEEWLTKAVEASGGAEQKETNRRARQLLINAMIELRDVNRFNDVEKAIAGYRDQFPSDSFPLLAHCDLAVATGRLSEAVEDMTRYISRSPQEAYGYFRRGQIQTQQGAWEAAVQDLRQAAALDPQGFNYEHRRLMALALLNLGQSSLATAELSGILNERPDLKPIAQQLYGLYFKAGQYEDAERLLLARMREDPNDPDWSEYLAAVYLNRKDNSRALQAAADAARKSGFDRRKVDVLLNLYLQLGQVEEMARYVNNTLPASQREDLNVLVKLAAGYARKDPARAQQYYQRCLELAQGRLITVRDLATNMAQALGRSKAEEILKQRLNGGAYDRAIRFALASLARHEGGPEAFEKAMRELLAGISGTDPASQADRLILLQDLAGSLHARRQLEEAKDVYEQILQIDPDVPLVLNNLAYLLMQDLNNPKAALPYSEHAVQNLQPDAPVEYRASVIDTYGWNLVLFNKYDEAVNRLRVAVSLAPGMSGLHYHLAEAYFRRSGMEDSRSQRADREEARKSCERARDLILQSGDREGIWKDLVVLAGKLGVTVPTELPTSQAAMAQ
jgi:tetratricopeptide (TPR) repeat protein